MAQSKRLSMLKNKGWKEFAPFVLMFFLSCSCALAQTKISKTPSCVPNEVIVKFKEGITPELALKDLPFAVNSSQRTYSIQPIIAKFKKDLKLEKSSDGW